MNDSKLEIGLREKTQRKFSLLSYMEVLRPTTAASTSNGESGTKYNDHQSQFFATTKEVARVHCVNSSITYK